MNSLIIESRLEQRLRNKIFKFCYICGDEASSKHFSALSCDACAAFFRRTVSGKKIYRCLFKQNCAIYNITPRRMCKFCRFQKCRQSGMNPDEVRSSSNSPSNSPPPKGFSNPNHPLNLSKPSTPMMPLLPTTCYSSIPTTSILPLIEISIPSSPPSLPSTLPSTLSSTLPSTLPSTLLPSNLLLTFPSTIPSTLPSTFTSTIPSTLPPTNASTLFSSTLPSTNAPTPFMKAFQRAIVLENSLFVAVKNPVLLCAYLQAPHDSKLLEVALKNFQKISDKFASFNNFFMFQYIESAGIALDPKMIQKFPIIDQLINQSLQQYAELIKIRIRNEFEFAALCQLSLLKIASEEFPQFQKILTQNYEIISQNFRDFHATNPAENASSSLANVSDITNTIHLIRKTYRNQICELLRTC